MQTIYTYIGTYFIIYTNQFTQTIYFTMKRNIIIFTLLIFSVLASNAQFSHIKNERNLNAFLNSETDNIMSSPIKPDWLSAQWQITIISKNTFGISNRWKECMLDVQKDKIVCSAFDDEASSQIWKITDADKEGYSLIMNITNNKYLCQDENGSVRFENNAGVLGTAWLIGNVGSIPIPNNEAVKGGNVSTPTNTSPKNTTPNPPTKPSGKSELSQAQIEGFLKEHNTARAAVGIGKVTWNPTIAEYADKWAKYLANEKGCNLEHRESSPYGENLFMGGDNSYATPNMIVGAWLEEKPDYHGGVIGWNTEAGHYTQVIWAKTTEIGCAIATCPDGGIIGACNYNPAGNMIGESPLTK